METGEQAVEWSWQLQWQPIMMAPTKEERYAVNAKRREENQRKREETVLIIRSFIFTIIGISLVLWAGACL